MTRTTVPFSLLLAAFDLSPEQRERVLPAGQPCSDVGRDMWFFRRLPNGRVLTGMFATQERLVREQVEQLLCRRFGAVFGVRPRAMTDLWGGRIGVTRSGLPQLLQQGPNVFGWTGCNGRGIALSFLLGRLLGEVASGADAATLALPLQPVHAPFGRGLQSWVGKKPCSFTTRLTAPRGAATSTRSSRHSRWRW
jgi:sarcosine oxidase